MKTRYILSFFLVMIIIPATAQNILTPEEAVGLALEQNYEVRISRNMTVIAENNVSPGNSGMLPDVDLSATQNFTNQDSRQEFLGNTTSEKENARSRSFNGEAIMNWTVFDGLLMFTTYKSLDVRKEQEFLFLRLQMEKTVSEVLMTYYEIILLKENIEAIEVALDVSREVKTLATDKRDIGAGSGLEVLQASIDVNQDASNLLDQSEQLRLAKIRLNELLGRAPDTEIAVMDTITIREDLNFAALKEHAMGENTLLQIERRDIDLAELDLKTIRSEHFPTIDLYAGYSYNTLQAESGFLLSNKTNGWNYGASLRYNIFNGLNVQRKKENARISIENARLEQDMIRLQVESDLLAAYTQYELALQKIDLEKQNVQSTRQTLDITMERYRLGDIAGIEMREARQRFLTAETRYISAMYRAKLAEIELSRLSGRLVQEQP